MGVGGRESGGGGGVYPCPLSFSGVLAILVSEVWGEVGACVGQQCLVREASQ